MRVSKRWISETSMILDHLRVRRNASELDPSFGDLRGFFLDFDGRHVGGAACSEDGGQPSFIGRLLMSPSFVPMRFAIGLTS
jgi:hypothetical protein